MKFEVRGSVVTVRARANSRRSRQTESVACHCAYTTVINVG